MREILFRGKRKDNGEWVFGNFVRGCIEDFAYIVEFGNKELCRNYVEVIPESISEFTGLTDKNGKKIFEGDIVKYSIYPPNKFEYGVVNWYHGGFRAGIEGCILCVCSADGVAEYQLEVIGNTIDNPELLKGGAE